jgi:hypothetical protein
MSEDDEDDTHRRRLSPSRIEIRKMQNNLFFARFVSCVGLRARSIGFFARIALGFLREM